jgi:hypothetical protein
MKEKALDRTKWRNRCGRGCGPVVWQITDDVYLYIKNANLFIEPNQI